MGRHSVSNTSSTSRRSARPARGRGDRGATAPEYAIVGSLVAAVVVVTVQLLGLEVLELFSRVSF